MYAYVGCRTTRERDARGRGVEVYAVGPTGDWHHRQTVSSLPNPSYQCLGKKCDVLYSVHGDGGEVSAFRIVDDGNLEFLNSCSSGGRNPVHIVADDSGRYLIVANYASGTVALVPVNADGSLDGPLSVLELKSEAGPHRMQQRGPHPHQVIKMTATRFYVPDKGADRIHTVDLDPGAGKIALDETCTVLVREGAGPRHGVIHPQVPVLYVVNELESTVTTYAIEGPDKSPRATETVSTLPRTCTGTSHAAGIAITRSGKWVFVSNRGDDSITSLKVDPSNGALSPVVWTKSGGRKPRYITLDPIRSELLVANEDSDAIVRFRFDESSGALERERGEIATGSPVCVTFLETAKQATDTKVAPRAMSK